ncbi:hypothetical protein [Microcoleus sp. FACHB-831]|nr:hypothetical protein [Microcoleus sp. FACHB-831]
MRRKPYLIRVDGDSFFYISIEDEDGLHNRDCNGKRLRDRAFARL